jgi:Flp pilus assembly pilin Flp
VFCDAENPQLASSIDGPFFPIIAVTEGLSKGWICSSRSFRDEAGGEVLEYALIAGLIVVAAIAVIGSVGSKVLAAWSSLNSSM